VKSVAGRITSWTYSLFSHFRKGETTSPPLIDSESEYVKMTDSDYFQTPGASVTVNEMMVRDQGRYVSL
jgi:hypothetical protein